MKTIQDFSTEELRAEIQRREDFEKIVPLKLGIDYDSIKKRWTKVTDMAAWEVNALMQDTKHAVGHSLARAAIEAVYGEDIWMKLNNYRRHLVK